MLAEVDMEPQATGEEREDADAGGEPHLPARRCGVWVAGADKGALVKNRGSGSAEAEIDRRYEKPGSERFAIRGVTAEAVAASRASSGTRISLERAQEIVLGSSSKRKAVEEEDSEEEEDGSSLVTRPRARRRIISDDEAKASPRHSVPLSKSIEAPVVIPDGDVDPGDTRESIEQLFISGFDSESLGPVLDETPLASFSTPVPVIPSLPPPAVTFHSSTVLTSTVLTSSTTPPLTIPPPIVHHTDVGSSSKSVAMSRVVIEVPAESSLLRKSGQADVWLEPLIGLIEKAKMESHSSLTLMNDIEQFESLQINVEFLQESKSTLEQQVRALTSELAVPKASSSQTEKEKERLESSFSEQLSKASEEIRELKVLLSQKETYSWELVQSLTQAQEDLRVSSDKVRALESSHASLQISYNSALTENEELKNEIAYWERDYETLEEKSAIEASWAFLNSRRDTLIEVGQENFNLESELAKINETIEKAQQTQDFPSPVVEASVNVEVNMGISTLPSPIEPIAVSQDQPATVDAPAQVEPKKKNEHLESSSQKLSKASEEIRELKVLLSQKETYSGELVQSLTQAQEDLRVSSDKVRALESSHASLQISYNSALAENEELNNEIADWERDYETLEEKCAIEASWAFLNSRRDTLIEAGQENSNLESELAKINETIEKAQQTQDFPSPVAEASVNVEVDMGISTLPSPIEPIAVSQDQPATVNAPAQVEPVAVDAPSSVPSSS
ncbi:PREDICTED: protein NETWORKED 1B-like [Nicotiana attenuata]|uniref:protein NETWORKED 1B-like n=1 Tax=Nicotiana attenuata TaxID=49451 RepID=UPI0009052511|nr:PREDICTED: protein NETWORKED 1B-like [Nicotiana attenuata]